MKTKKKERKEKKTCKVGKYNILRKFVPFAYYDFDELCDLQEKSDLEGAFISPRLYTVIQVSCIKYWNRG